MLSAATQVQSLLNIKNCIAELWVNDIPLSRLSPAALVGEGQAIEQFLIPGTNKLELLVEPGATPSRARSDVRKLEPKDAAASALVARYSIGEAVTPETGVRPLARVKWETADLKGEPDLFPRSLVAEFDAGPAHGRWGWQDAPILTAGAALFDEARDVLQRELGDVFRTRSGALYYSLTEEQCKDAMRAYPAWDEATVRAELKEQAEIDSGGVDPVVPIDPEKNDFRIVGGGRMIQCVDVDWTTSLKLRSKTGALVPIPVLLARIGKRLRVVR